MISLKVFCYSYFNPLGKALLRVYKGLEGNMEAANMKIHPEVYLSMVSFLSIVTSSIPITFFFILPKIFPNLLNIPTLFHPFYLLALSPFLVLVVGLLFPKILASNRVSSLKVEIPYASMYMSVMASGGVSPYRSLLRIRRMGLLPKLSDEIKRIQRLVLSSGLDPVSSMERAAKVVGLSEYKELLLGYASTLRTGGDVLHYLHSQTEIMFRNMAAKIKAMGENMAILMEAYTIIGILGSLGLYMMFVVSFAMPDMGMAIPPELFLLFSFIILPLISVAFMYMGDRLQINYPVSCWKNYLVFVAMLPLGLLLITQTVLSFFSTNILFFPFLQNFILILQTRFGFMDGSEPALGLAFSLIVISIPIAIVDYFNSKKEGGILQGITRFLRDLVETRKTGLGPERCIQALSKKDYGRFSNHLKTMSSELSWGFSLRKILEDFSNKVKNWLSQVNMYLLIDTIEIGGGSEESLETLATFSESVGAMEKERKSLLLPLLIVPYMGAFLLTATTIMFLQFFTDMTFAGGASIPYISLCGILLPPLIFHCYMVGLVTGKTISGRLSSGFKHAIFLSLVAIIGIWLTSSLNLFGIFGG